MGRWDARKLKWKEAREGQDGLHDAVPESALQFAVAAIAWRRVKGRGLLLLLSVSHASNPKQCDGPDAMLPVPATVPQALTSHTDDNKGARPGKTRRETRGLQSVTDLRCRDYGVVVMTARPSVWIGSVKCRFV